MVVKGGNSTWAREMSTDKLDNPGNRVTTIDTNGVGQSNDLAKPVHALSMKLFRTYAGEDRGLVHAYSSGRTPT